MRTVVHDNKPTSYPSVEVHVMISALVFRVAPPATWRMSLRDFQDSPRVSAPRASRAKLDSGITSRIPTRDKQHNPHGQVLLGRGLII